MHYSINSTQDAVMHSNSKAHLTARLGWLKAKVQSVKIPGYVAAHKAFPVRLLKMDCEGCEFEAIPAMSGFLDDKTKVEQFTAEIHYQVMNRTLDAVRAAARPSKEALDATKEMLRKRGCPTSP